MQLMNVANVAIMYVSSDDASERDVDQNIFAS
jgi:hypothetical protein